jgi:AGZA family xanthine/uracil permease-like MFS transporter
LVRGEGRLTFLDRWFDLERNGTTVARELRAGATTFLTMAYILFVNPQILSQAGMPAEDVAVATALAAGVGTALMGLWARYPFAMAPGMGLNAYFTYGVVAGLGVTWQVALAAIFIQGVLFLVLAGAGARRLVLQAIPATIRHASMAGIGLFLAFIGLHNGGLVAPNPATLVELGDIRSPAALLTLGGILLVAVLASRRVPGSILIGVGAVSALAWALDFAALPERWIAAPRLPRETFLAMDFSGVLEGGVLAAVAAFLFVTLLDTAGTLLGVGMLGGFVDRNGDLPRANRAFAADAISTTLGACLGTSPTTAYIESATGIEEGGRTGLTAVTVAALFFAALVFSPIFVAVPAAATAPALVVVGALMMRGAIEIEWKRFEEAIPGFVCLSVMPFTFSIANGLALGIVTWVAIRVLTGRASEVKLPLWLLAAGLAVFLFFLEPW